MTRWARSGNSQNHQKQPEDPTPWEEFASQMNQLQKRKRKKNTTQKHNQNVQLKHFSQQPSGNESAQASTSNISCTKEKKLGKSFNFSGFMNKDKGVSQNLFQPSNKNNEPEASTSNVAFDNEKLKGKKKKLMKSFSFSGKDKKVEDKESLSFPSTNLDSINETKDTKSLKRKKKKKKFRPNIEDISSPILVDNLNSSSKKKKVKHELEKNSNLPDYDESSQESFPLSSPEKTSLKLVTQEKERFMERLKKKRTDQGLLLLPKNVETKIYKMKKNLREKGMPGENVKEIIRRVRRKEELKFRKTLKTCFKCRKSGHIMSECPLLVGNYEEGTGICFKCGSTEHTSFKCSIKTSDYPFAKCFICKEEGHISRSCPKNKHGIYPKGGSCNLCGNVNHLRKDCPTLQKKKGEEEMTVGTLETVQSVDDIDSTVTPVITSSKKPKVVKF